MMYSYNDFTLIGWYSLSNQGYLHVRHNHICLLYTSPSPRDLSTLSQTTFKMYDPLPVWLNKWIFFRISLTVFNLSCDLP